MIGGKLTKPATLCAAAALIVVGCSGSAGEGELTITAYGEAFIEEGIPAGEMKDGWAVTFESFVVTIKDIEVAGVVVADPDPVDLSVPSEGRGHALATVTAPAGVHSDAGFTIARIELRGSATKAGSTKTFDWVFDGPTRYTRCDAKTEVFAGGTATFQITVHADHLFYDSMVSHEPSLFFGALAGADADADGKLGQSELAAAGIGAYDPGNEDIDDLWSWLTGQTRTLGHVDGEGHCVAQTAEH